MAGIVLGAGKEYLVEARLAPVAEDHELASIDALITELATRRVPALLEQVVDAMTTNETSFLRDRHPFAAFCDEVVPKLIAAREGTRRLYVWSAACSTGQEPYTLAMLLADRFPQLADWDVRILATDLSPRVLAQAKAGRYSQVEVNRGLPAKMMVKHFTRDGTDWVVKDDIKARVTFRQLNLIEPWQGVHDMDVVFMRNVLIYFDPETKAVVLNRARKHMRDDAWLFLGAAETTLGLCDRFERVTLGETSCYRTKE